MRDALTSLAGLFLSICVLFGTWGLVFWQIAAPFWAELAIAAGVALAAGALVPRELPAWLAWPILVVLAWAAYVFAAIAILPGPLVPQFLTYPLAASVGAAAGLAAWRMPMRRVVWRPLPIVLGAALVVGIFFLRGPLVVWGQPAPRLAPAFVLHLLNGKKVSSDALAGKTVVLAFWATWCAPCRKELPELQKFYMKHYATRKEVRFYLVDEGLGAETRAKAQAFLAHFDLTMPAAFDANGKLGAKLDTRGVLPVRVVIGPRGLVRLIDYGYIQGDKAFPALRKAIRAAAKATAR
ncbi:MAG: redoxin domain-containing protein [Gammaproteobacteria bacterium]